MTAIAVPRSDAALLGRWVAARVRMTLRSPRALGFTFAFPLVLVTLFSAINGDVDVKSHGVDIPFSQFYTPAIAHLRAHHGLLHQPPERARQRP